VSVSPDRLGEQLLPLGAHEALVEANRCLYCFDAPCTHACPTHIDIPRFIKKIATGNLTGSARTILESNLMGATCARVCPVQELCEGACVLNAEEKPIMIGRLQRYATDHVYDHGIEVFRAGPPTGRRVAVIGAGPAGLSCAGELARRGHEVTIFEKRALAGGLSTFGIIALREPVPVALAEVGMVQRLGVKIVEGMEAGRGISGTELLATFDAIFVAAGLGATPSLGIAGEELILDGLEYIERSKLSPEALPRAASAVVIGAGNTAIDCATVARRSGVETVTMVYRRTEREMTAYAHEYEFVKNEGVRFEFLAQPCAVVSDAGQVAGLACMRMELGEADASGRPAPRVMPGAGFTIAADLVIKAIGQKRTSVAEALGLECVRGFIRVDENLATSVARIWAGGDCVRAKGAASTVMAAQDGRIAAGAIHEQLMKAPARVAEGANG
jgi:glutamate synthase (NADPH/NADH) small chain